MSKLKQYKKQNVYSAAVERIAYAFDNFEKIYVSFSGGKDSSVMFHMVATEAIKRKRKIGVLVIDLEAQYKMTISHVAEMVEIYRDHIDLHWVCLPMLLRNAVSNFEPRWCCWDPDVKDLWVREMPNLEGVVSDPAVYDFFLPKMEFEEFMVLWGQWYSGGAPTCGMVGIRADESLNRFRTVTSKTKECFDDRKWTTKVSDNLYNGYPIYDWKTEDIWRFHAKNANMPFNHTYEYMHKAGLTVHQMRLCQPYGDDQRKGLWLYHILEPETWFKVVSRVSGANGGALYVTESGNMTGYRKINKPAGHTWKSFCELLLSSLPEKTRRHYMSRFRGFIKGWKSRGYVDGIPDEAPHILESKMWAPSYRRLCKVLLRNDWWCKGLGLTQPKSEAYGKYLEIKKKRKLAVVETGQEPGVE
jgi:predicted phosphoadenosine phosphosulfate sulfurtransferase